MSGNVKRLLNDKWPVVPIILSLLVVLAPVFLVFLPAWIRGIAERTDIDMAIIRIVNFVPAIVYIAAVSWGMRGRVAVWWLLPARPHDIGRALWWQLIGIPAIALLIAMVANVAIVFPLIRNYGYFDLAGHQYADLMAIVVNWGAWTLLRYGSFRHRNPGQRRTNGPFDTVMHWAGAGVCLLCLAGFEIYSTPADWTPTTLVIVLLPLCLTATAFYATPTLSVWFNELREERSGSKAALLVGGIVPVLFAVSCLFFWGWAIYQVCVGAWALLTSATTVIDTLLALGRFVMADAMGIVTLSLTIFLLWVGFNMIRAWSASAAPPELDALLDPWPRRGRYGLINVTPLAFWTLCFLGLLAWRRWHGLELGLLVSSFAALLPMVALHCEKRVLAGLPIDPARLTATLHIGAAIAAAIPLVPTLAISALNTEWADFSAAAACWLLGAAVGQLGIPFRMNQQGLPTPIRWAMYGAMIGWIALAVFEVWVKPFGLSEQFDGFAASAAGASPTTGGMSNTVEWVLPLAVAGFILFAIVAVYRTTMDLTRDAGARYSGKRAA